MKEDLSRPPLITIVGPTASGKTALAIRAAQMLAAEIVSADSRQIYRGMDIGTAKPTHEEMALIPHHLIDIKNPDEEYTVADYQRDAIATIDDILARHKIPIMAGGTGLYVRAVVENLNIPTVKADPAIREAIEKDINEKGLSAVFQQLVERDPEAEYIVDPQNPRRVIRALEVAIATGEPFTAQRKKSEPRYNVFQIGITQPWELLKERIEKRIDHMMTNGLVDEVETLVKKYGPHLPAFDAIGYREIIDYLKDACTLEAAIAAMKMDTIHYAKRQLTWFRKDATIQWVETPEDGLRRIAEFMEKK